MGFYQGGERHMQGVKKAITILRDFVEIYIPVAAFVILFCTFIWQVFSRYVLCSALDWTYEITVTCYLWMVMLGACYAQRTRSHVVFTLVYDSLPTRLKAFTSFLGNGLIAFAFIWSLPSSIKMIDFMKMQKTSIFRIGLNVVYAPYIPFAILIIIYMLVDMYHDFRIFTGLATTDEVNRMLKENMSETQEAIEAAKEGDPV